MSFAFLIAAPSSGCGKTLTTLALLRAFRDRGMRVASAKSGPDFIDPAFHNAASGESCVNLDAWAMRENLILTLAHEQAQRDGLIIEGAMGLFDGAVDGTGSAADLAKTLNCKIILVLDAARQSQSIAALVHGFATFRPDVQIAGIIANRVGSARHGEMIRKALEPLGIPLFGIVPKDDALILPSRHLGLVQAQEHANIEAFIAKAASIIAQTCDLGAMAKLKWSASQPARCAPSIAPPGQVIAVAKDEAFSFAYSHILSSWREAGAEIRFFSPLADQPLPGCDSVFLPGGYPELHAGKIAGNSNFLESLRLCAKSGIPVYGECGGFMVLGEGLVDKFGNTHAMAGLLPAVTTFANGRRQLGYRRARLVNRAPFLGNAGQIFATHEFHYTSLEKAGDCEPMAEVEDAAGANLGVTGMVRGNVAGSYLHIIDRA